MSYRTLYEIKHSPIKNDALMRAASRASHRTKTYVAAASSVLAKAAFSHQYNNVSIDDTTALCSIDIEVEISR